MVKYDSSGFEKWVAEYDGNNNNGEDEFYDLVMDINHDLLVAGRSYGDTTSYDFLIIKYLNSTSGIPVIESGNPSLQVNCYPNPIHGSACISYYLPETGDATIRILDLTGKTAAIMENRKQSKGNHTMRFQAAGFADGIYLCQVSSGNKSAVVKISVQR